MNLKLAFRRLLKTPLVSAVAILSLALGIGANAAIFSLFDQALLGPLPVRARPSWSTSRRPGPKPGSNSCGQAGGCDAGLQLPDVPRPRAAQTVFTGIAGHVSIRRQPRVSRGRRTSGGGMLVSGSYFPVLGLRPAIGRLLDVNDDQHHRRPLRRRAQPRATGRRRLGAQPERPQQHADRQRPGADDRRRRAARLHQHHARPRTGSVRAADDARADGAGVEGLREPPQLLGVHVRAAQARRTDRAGARGDERRLHADHQRRRGAAAEGHERADDGAVQGQGARSSTPGSAGRARCTRRRGRR